MYQQFAETTCIDCKRCCAGEPGFSEEEAKLLIPNKRSVQYAAGDVIVKQGSLADFVYFLNKGLVKIVLETDRQRNIILEIVSPDRFIGLNCINLPSESPVSFVALTDCHVCQIRKQYMMKISQTNEVINENLTRCNGEEYLFLYKKMALFGAKNNHGRLANILLYLSSERYVNWDIYSVISRKEIAELTAMSIESMNKILKEFREDLIIEIDDKKINILQPDLLRRISHAG